MRLATYNVEWFNSLFDNKGRLLRDDDWSARWNVTRAQQADALGVVFKALNADAIMIIEAPDDSRQRSAVQALETFADTYGVRARRALIGYPNDTQQEIALLYDPDALTARHAPGGDDTAENPRFDSTYALDVDVDGRTDLITWSKPPLEVEIGTKSGAYMSLIGVHAKSKSAHGIKGRSAAMLVSIENRRKQLAQCIWLRKRVEQILSEAKPLIVMGDFNDGPGLDEYEKLFGRSGVEIVLGEGNGTQLFDPHAQVALGSRIGVMPSTARFQNRKGPFLQALLDYIMVSPDIRAQAPEWTIWHPFDHPDCYADENLREALLAASDHFPVTLDLVDT